MIRFLLGLGVFFASLHPISAAVPWADAKLPVHDGLRLWLDAGLLNASRLARGQKPLHDGDRVAAWYDASGNGHDVVQAQRTAQPTFVGASGAPGIRFNGMNSFLSLSGQKASSGDLTLFVVAAPLANPGGFHGLLAMNEGDRNDYTSGLNLDMGPTDSPRFQTLNCEGMGFGGAVNLMQDAFDFGTMHTLEVTSRRVQGETRLYVDGKLQGRRARVPLTIHMDRITVGARFYTNGGPAQVRGFLDGDIYAVLLYQRLLNEAERHQVENYLATRYPSGRHVASSGDEARHRLVRVAHPPAVQMLVPGFTARELPVHLPNINNVRYRPDGKLVALGYNGNIYLLSDPAGAGIENTVELFWENKGSLRAPIGMALTPPGYKLGQGVFVASKGKLSLIVDSRGTGKADREIIVAQGWKEIPHGVDALGVALDQEGNIYFGLGTTDFTNPYVVDRQGKAHYDVRSERGTILKVSPDFRRRTIVATGIRFSVGLAFNRRGDLFATDQEGATWLANGNPLDELLHIEPGRHYGFPPRHPRFLPGVIDEPSVFDYGPQHQSTCGLAFDEPANGGPVFGPTWWRGDALVTGYSRGKLYRTQLVHTKAGYVAQNRLLACLNMLAVDSCVSPHGDLVVAVHGGLPDWGNGPEGKGKLYQLSFTGRDRPQQVLAWSASPREVHIAFDRPLDPDQLHGLLKRVTVEYGKYVRPGDRFELHRPGYEAVQQQLAAPRYALPVLAAEVTRDLRTIVLTTPPETGAVFYAVTLDMSPTRQQGTQTLPQAPAMDFGYQLTGLQASFAGSDGKTWTGWLPHADLTVSRALTVGSAAHDRLWKLLAHPGRLTMRTKLDLWQMLRPAVQPGSTLDYTLPEEQVTITFASPGLASLKVAGKPVPVARQSGQGVASLTAASQEGHLLPVELALDSSGPTRLDVSWTTREDTRPRALPLRRFLLPWADAQPERKIAAIRPELRGGNWLHGREIFFSEPAQCSKCHTVGGQGGRIGPDLSNLFQRDVASVLRDIREPSAAINPDYIAHLVELTDGRILTGTLRSAGDQLVIGDTTGKETAVLRTNVATSRPSAVSIMPQGLDRTLGPGRLRDLLTFLLTEPLKPAPILARGVPPPRKLSDVEAVLKGSKPSAKQPRKLQILLSFGPQDHGPGEHDYPLWARRWSTLLGLADGVTVTSTRGWPTAEQFRTADVIVFYSDNPGWSAAGGKALDDFLARGGGLVFIHYAVDGHNAVPQLAQRIGLAWQAGNSRYRHGVQNLTFHSHPVTRNFDRLKLVDESYWALAGDPSRVRLLATGIEEKAAQPLLWVREQGKGRVFVSIPGHYTWTFDDPLFRVLLLRGIAWTAHESVDRFNGLVTIGARLAD